MDHDSVQSCHVDKSDVIHPHLVQQQKFPGGLTDSRQHINFVPSASANGIFSRDLERPELPSRNAIGQPSIYHPGYAPNWDSSLQQNISYLPYSQPVIFQPQQCMNIIGWSESIGQPVNQSPAFAMQSINQPHQQFLHSQHHHPTINIDTGALVQNLQQGPISNASNSASNHRVNKQKIDQYCSNVHDETAWAENATAVTGATSETGLSGDNMSRFGARYGLISSLNHNNGSSSCIGGAAAALIRTEIDDLPTNSCAGIFNLILFLIASLCSIFSPVLMVIFPYLPTVGWKTDSCEPTCEGSLIGMVVKVILVGFGTWILLAPQCPLINNGRHMISRIRIWHSLFLCSIFVVLFAFWLFYSVRILQPKDKTFESIVIFSNSLSDTLLFMNFAGIALLELNRMKSQFSIHVVRSPDGVSKTYKLGDMSIQKAALEILQMYMIDFTVYTQPSSSSSSRRGKHGQNVGAEIQGGVGGSGNDGGSKYKFYDVDSRNGTGIAAVEKIGGEPTGQATGHTGPSASSRLYDEMETEKRVRKRRMRLLLAVEDAFAHANRMAKNKGIADSDGTVTNSIIGRNSALDNHIHLSPYHSGNEIAHYSQEFSGQSNIKRFDPYEAAQTVFPTLIRPLQKYMRATRQQSRHPVDSVIDHLAMCLTYGLSPLSFLERFNPISSTPQQDAATAASALTAARSISQRHRQPLTIACPTDSEGAYKPPKKVSTGGQQVWSIVTDRLISRNIAEGVVFQLKRFHGNIEISLLCTVHKLPLLNLVEGSFESLHTEAPFTQPPNSRVSA